MKLKFFASLSICALAASISLGAQAQQVTRKPYLVQLVDAPVAAYEGGVAGLSATRPGVGQKLDMASARVQSYQAFLNTKVNAVTAKVPSAAVYQRYSVVVTGFAAMLSPDELNALSRDPAVRAITADEGMSIDTSYTSSRFLKLGDVGGAWSRKDSQGRDIKGENVIIGILDTGVWPENRSVSDKVDGDGKPVPSHEAGTVVYDPLPVGRFKGICQVGPGFTAAMCNNKLIGAQVFNATFKLVQGANVWPGEYDSPRDEDGHGSHVMTTAGGNAASKVTVGGGEFEISGVAPRARVAAYKVCSAFTNASNARQNTCFTGDAVQAYEKAVADGVDVINFSISGSSTAVNGLVAQAMLGAAKANVFVAASAGNSGPAAASPAHVAHISPWVMTVGNSTHDRYTEAVVTLGSSGVTVRGASWQTAGLSTQPLVWSRRMGFGINPSAAAQGSNQALCFGAADGVAALLDPEKVAGKIIVCDRGGNILVNKVINARAAGALGVIIQNTPVSLNTTPLISAVLPTVHVPASGFIAVTTEAVAANGTASFGPGIQVPGVVAPVMAGSSSRGPNQFDANVLKPDITGPGSDIIAAYTAAGVTLAERADIIAGTVFGRQGADLLTGTSMSSPHVAGAAALMRQLNPTWSVAAIKSALMTSGEQIVKLASGAADLGVTAPNRLTVGAGVFGFGAGHLAPNPALSTTAVYDISNAQFDAYSAGAIGTGLNLASITFSNVLGVGTTIRTVKNMGAAPLSLTATGTLAGFTVTVSPMSFTIPVGASQSFTVTVTRTTATFGSYIYGNLTLAGGGQSLRSPLTARASSAVVTASFTETRNVGTRITTIGTGFSGPTTTTASGMVAATRTSSSVAINSEVCFPMVVPANTWAIRAQLYNSDTQGGVATDLDLYFRPATGTSSLARSEREDSNEVVNLTAPAAGTYRACVAGYDSLVSAAPTFTISTWIVPTPVGVQTLRAAGPSTAVMGGTASLVMSWTTAASTRSLGAVRLSQTGGPALTQTLLYVDALSLPGTLSAAPVLRNKPLPPYE